MKVKMLLCNCKGLCPSFAGTDMNTLPFQLESELDVEYTVLHPQLCGQGGSAVLEDVLRTADRETYVIVGACAPEAQRKLFKKVLRTTGFDEQRFVAVDIRGTDNDGILERLREAVRRVLSEPQEVAVG
jgi:heterodisulfide reductase subunit A-like polyferredoxin